MWSALALSRYYDWKVSSGDAPVIDFRQWHWLLLLDVHLSMWKCLLTSKIISFPKWPGNLCYSAQATMAEYHRRGGLNKWNLFLAVLDQGASMASSGEGSHPILQTESSRKDSPPVVSGPLSRPHLTWVTFFTGPVSVYSHVGSQQRNFFGRWGCHTQFGA